MLTSMDKLRGKIAERGITKEELSRAIGVDPSTLARKLKADGLTFTVGQVQKMADVLKLDDNEARDIFFSRNSH